MGWGTCVGAPLMISFGVYHKKYNVRHSHVGFASTLTISQEKYLEVYMCIHWFMQEVISEVNWAYY